MTWLFFSIADAENKVNNGLFTTTDNSAGTFQQSYQRTTFRKHINPNLGKEIAFEIKNKQTENNN